MRHLEVRESALKSIVAKQNVCRVHYVCAVNVVVVSHVRKPRVPVQRTARRFVNENDKHFTRVLKGGKRCGILQKGRTSL